MLETVLSFFSNLLFVDILFLFFSLFAIAFSLMVVLISNPVYSSLALITSFLPIAAIYVLLHASFIAVIQILVYAGAIMVLFTFVIMLIDLNPHDFEKQKSKLYQFVTFFVAMAFFLWMPLAIQKLLPQQDIRPSSKDQVFKYFDSQKEADQFGSVAKIGEIIFGKPSQNAQQANLNTINSPQIFSFELSSVLIMVAIVGVVLLIRKKV